MAISIDEIADNIAEARCVILLGPNVGANNAGEPIQTALLTHLVDQGLKVSEDVDGLYRCDEATRRRLYTPIKKYYRANSTPNNLHRQLARIPAHLIISLTPDLALRAALSELGINHDFSYYAKQSNPAPVGRPSKERPLLYNLFGNIEDDASLILTHVDLIQFIFSIIRDFKLPDELRTVISEASYFVFLGFDFQKWYLQLLLNLFRLNREKPSQAAEPENLTPSQLRDFYGRNYGLEFIDSGVVEYVDKLYKYCESTGQLREAKVATPLSLREGLLNRLMGGEIDGVIMQLADHLEHTENRSILAEVITLSGDHSRLMERKKKGQITQEDIDIEYNKITARLISIIEEALPPSGG
jgi:Effector-associated domain 11/SIR2-like domain